MPIRLFDLAQATHYCQPLAGHAPSPSPNALYVAVTKGKLFEEGKVDFDVHRLAMLNQIERWLMYSVAHYRRSLDMFVPATAPWAQVTLYYSSFFAANAILGMFGGWVGHSPIGNRIVDVDDGTIGAQRLRLALKQKSPSGASGSHRAFWDFFYDAVPAIRPWAAVELAHGLDAPSGGPYWQIDRRNDVNYDMAAAWQASVAFRPFRANRFRQSMAADLATQIEATEGLVKVALAFATSVRLHSFAFEGAGIQGTRAQIQRRLVTQQAPSVVNHSSFQALL